MSDSTFINQKRPFSGPPSFLEPEAKNLCLESVCVPVKPSEKVYKCGLCENTFKQNRSLKMHVEKQHPAATLHLSRGGTACSENFTCNFCGQKFKLEKHLTYHKKNKHLGLPPVPVAVQKCALCERQFSKNAMIDHYKVDHDVMIESEYLDFATFKDFTVWKSNIESETQSRFVKEHGDTRFENINRQYYMCHRSGIYIPQGQQKRHMKTQGSCKMNGFCPSSMKVKQIDGGRCEVHFVKTHVGHQTELGHLRLTAAERETIAHKLSSKVPFDAVLNEIRDSITDNNLKRLHLLTRKDLHNIESSYNLNSDIIRHTDDAISLESWILEDQHKINSSVLLYKPQGELDPNLPLCEEDFLLVIMNEAQCEILQKFGNDAVCMDSTRGLNSFELITLLVIDDMRQGFPSCFMISNRCDKEVLMIFLNAIKIKCGLVTPDIFMSDMAESFMNAWVEVMGTPNKRLFCTWHIDRAWKSNLKKINNVVKQAEVYKTLRVLLEEQDEVAFEKEFKKALENWSRDPDTVDFCTYLKTYYVKNKTAWAYRYRQHCGLNTNMHLERMHRELKHRYLEGKNVKRLDKAVHKIMKLVRDKLFDRLIMLHKGKITSKLRDLRQRHDASTKLPKNVLIIDENKWNVLSTDGDEFYEVVKIRDFCTCRLTCTVCNACLHMYTCSCVDSPIKWNMCKHIHLLCTYQNEQNLTNNHSEETDNLYIDENSSIKECEQLATHLSVPSSSTSLEREKIEIKRKMDVFLSTISRMEDIDIVKKHMKCMMSTVAAANSGIQSQIKPTKSPANKHILPQRKPYAAKKPRKKTAIARPSKEEALKIAASLLLNEGNVDTCPE